MFRGGDYEGKCQERGGHVVTTSSTGVGVNPSNGQPIVTTSYNDMCLTADGRILEVK